MNIRVSVYSARAQKEIAVLQAKVKSLEAQLARANGAAAGLGTRGIPGITKWGNQLQWAGRQLQYNFTLPILLAGAAATKFALDNEKAMVRVVKVYGDGSEAMNQLSKTEIPALEKAFVALSNRFAIAQSDAINIAADWAAAGASGVALARSVKLTMETMVLGELEAKEATEALIAIQAQYNFNTKELIETIDVLNMVENQTGISMAGLIQGMARSAGVAREMGVDVQHLAAMMAALVPATGSAAAAGNGLKTILSRLMSPTNEANEVMMKMGINTKDLAWQSLNATQRLEKMASVYVTLHDAQKIVVASTAASRWQINRFGQLMTDINNPLGYYHRSLQATADTSKNFAQRQKELNTVLESSPQRLKQIWVMLQNTMANVIQPAIPMILILADALAKAFKWFSNLDPVIQKLGLAFLVLLAAIGPVVRYMGSVGVLLGVLQEAFRFAARQVLHFGEALLSLIKGPFKLFGRAAMGLGGLFMKLGSIIASAWGSIVGAVSTAGTAIVAGFATFMGGLRVVGLFFLDIAAVMKTSLTLMATNVVAIWAGTWRAIAVLFLNGTKLLMAIQMIFTQNFVKMFAVLGTNILGLWRVIVLGLILNWGRFVAAIPAMLAAVPAVLMTILGGIGTAIAAVFTSWVGLAVLAVTALFGVIYSFREEIAEAFKSIPRYFARNAQSLKIIWLGITDFFGAAITFIQKMFWKLPQGIQDALLSVLRIVQTIVMKIYEWLTYLNPFAKHSPSLVEQVTKGMAVIKAQYASVGNVGGIFKKAARDIEAYKSAIGTMGAGPFSNEREDVATYFKSALPLFDALISDLKVLNGILAQQEKAVNAQQAVVDAWEAALDQANMALDEEERKLDSLEEKLNSLTDAYTAHQNALEAYADAPLQGMGAMEDAIFANQQAQNQLRLEMLKWEQVNGSIEDVKSNMSALAGSMEVLRGEAASLRASGAGSDILGPIQDEIAAMQTAYDAMGTSMNNSPVSEMQAELARLGKEGEILDLEKSLKFDGMIREIDKLANATTELSFEQIVAGINAEKTAMAALEPQIASATAAVNAQKAAVDSVKAARDSLQSAYDAEKAKLDVLKNSYEQTANAIRDVESALNDMGSAATTAGSRASATAASGYQSPGAENFDNAAGGNFPDVSGTGAQIGREGDFTDQSDLIDQFTKDTIAEMERTLGGIDMFGGIKKKWEEFKNWWTINVERNFIRITEGLKTLWEDFSSSFGDSGIGSTAQEVWGKITSGAQTAWDAVKRIYDLFEDDLKKVWKEIVEAGKKIWEEIGPELEKFKELLPGLTILWDALWKGLKIAAGIVGALLIGAFKILSSILAHTLGPAIDIIIGVFKALVKIVRGVIELIVGVFTGDLQMAVNGVKDIFGGLIGGIVDVIKGGWNLIWGAVEGLVNGVIDWVVWLADELVGHSIIPDMIMDIVDWFANLPQWVLDAIKNLAVYIKDVVVEAWDNFKKASTDKWNDIATWLKARGQAAYDKLISVKDKLQTAAKESWQAFKDKSVSMWDTFITYLKARPQQAYDNFIAVKDKLIAVAKAAFEAFQTKAKDIVDGKNGLMTWIGNIPGRIAGLLGAVGTKVADSVKASWNAAAKWINDNGIGAINKVTTKFGFTLGDLPRFAGGGVIPGKVSARDNTIIAARTGEGVIVPELVRKLGGARGLAQLNNAARSGNSGALASLGVERFADGGIIGKVTGWLTKGAGNALGNIIGAMKQPVREIMPGKPFMEDWAVGALQGWQDKAKAWGDKQESMGNGVLPGTGYQWQTKVLKERFPWAQITSDFRPGSMTASGYTSMHALGRAIDVTPSTAIFDWIYNTYGKNTKELFYGPRNGKNIRRGKDVTIGGALLADHYDHVHWGYDKGGILPPGMTMAQNGTGRNEITLTGAQWDTFSSVVALLDSMTLKSAMGATPGSAAVARVGATLATVQGRLRAAETRGNTLTQGSGGTTVYNFYGDLEFPNVRNGSDAEDFLTNLKGLGG